MLLLMLSPDARAALDARRCTHKSGIRYEASWKHGGAMPGPNTVMSREQWWYGDVLLGETVKLYMAESPPATLKAEWGTFPERAGRDLPRFGEVHFSWDVRLSRIDGAPLHPDLGLQQQLRMSCTDTHVPPRP